jgi:hypothetical protein
MPYQVTRVDFRPFPDAASVDGALSPFSTGITDLTSLIKSFVCTIESTAQGGYQQYVATHLESLLRQTLTRRPGNALASSRYSPNLGEKADLAIGANGGRSLFFEIEFRPNVEKDLVKFHIGHLQKRLAAAILILSLDRNRLNPGYGTMPQYDKFVRVITEFQPQYPLLLIGIDGEHVAPLTTPIS